MELDVDRHDGDALLAEKLFADAVASDDGKGFSSKILDGIKSGVVDAGKDGALEVEKRRHREFRVSFAVSGLAERLQHVEFALGETLLDFLAGALHAFDPEVHHAGDGIHEFHNEPFQWAGAFAIGVRENYR